MSDDIIDTLLGGMANFIGKILGGIASIVGKLLLWMLKGVWSAISSLFGMLISLFKKDTQ